jgi:hypothetical protein
MTTFFTHLLAFVLGGVVSYLVLRNNPKLKSEVDAAADKGEAEIKSKTK